MSDELVPAPVVVGLGNAIGGDDGLGIAVLRELESAWAVPPAVRIVDGGTWGLNLLPIVESASRILFVDAIDLDAPVGTFIVLENEQIPRYLSMKVSPHQIDLREILALAELRGTLPLDMIAIGLQPGSTDMSTELTPKVRRNLHRVVQEAVDILARWGFPARPRDEAARA